jgi:cell division protein FtsN
LFLADNQSIGPKGPLKQTEKGEGPRVAVFVQRAEEQDLPPAWLAPEAWRLHAGSYDDSEEAEFGNA